MITSIYRSSHQRRFIKKRVRKNFAKYTGKHLPWSVFLIKLQAFRLATLLKRDSYAGAEIYKIFNNTSFEKHLRTTASRSSHKRCSIIKGVLKSFAKFTGKHLYQSLFFNKVAGLQFYLKRDSRTGVLLRILRNF